MIFIYIYIYICMYVYDILFLATLNVWSLYTNIPNNEGIKAVREAYDNHSTKVVATKVILTFLSLILTLNNFFLTPEINYK